jgi:hypothetical protein
MDAPVLRRLAAAFGGHVLVYVEGRSPKSIWTVTKKAELMGLVTYFDYFPLRADKGTDYALWREMVILYAANASPVVSSELAALGGELQAGRHERRAEAMAT